MLNEEHSKVLNKITEVLGDQYTDVSDEEYAEWKERFELLSEHEKVFQLLCVMSQYLLSGCRASAAIFAGTVVCISRWCDEKEQDDF